MSHLIASLAEKLNKPISMAWNIFSLTISTPIYQVLVFCSFLRGQLDISYGQVFVQGTHPLMQGVRIIHRMMPKTWKGTARIPGPVRCNPSRAHCMRLPYVLVGTTLSLDNYSFDLCLLNGEFRYPVPHSRDKMLSER